MTFLGSLAPLLLTVYAIAMLSLRDHWAWKLLVAWVVALFATEPTAVFLLCVAIIIDFFTGISAARKRGEKITGKKARASITKVIQYAVFLGLVVGVSNRYAAVSWFAETGFFFATILELSSVVKNLSTKGGNIRQLWDAMWRKMTSMLDHAPASVINESPPPKERDEYDEDDYPYDSPPTDEPTDDLLE